MNTFRGADGLDLTTSRLPGRGENTGHLSPPMCAGDHGNKDIQGLQIPSDESLSREKSREIQRTEGRGEDYIKYLP